MLWEWLWDKANEFTFWLFFISSLVWDRIWSPDKPLTVSLRWPWTSESATSTSLVLRLEKCLRLNNGFRGIRALFRVLWMLCCILHSHVTCTFKQTSLIYLMHVVYSYYFRYGLSEKKKKRKPSQNPRSLNSLAFCLSSTSVHISFKEIASHFRVVCNKYLVEFAWLLFSGLNNWS